MRTLVELFTGLEQLAQDVKAAYPHDLRVYALRPDQIECPAIYHVIDPSQTAGVDTAVDRDSMIIGARVAIWHTDAEEQWARLLELGDTYCEIVDPALRDRDHPIWTARGQRTGIQQFQDRFNEVPVFGLEFPIRAQLHRRTA